MLAYDYPLLGFFWTMLMVLHLGRLDRILLFRVFADIFRSHDMGGWRQGAVGDLRDHRAVPRRVRST